MSEDFFSPDVAQKLIRAAKDAPVNFAFVQAASPDKSLLGIDKHKHGDQIFAILKKAAGFSKGCFGTVTCNGSVASFACDKPISGLEKLLNEWFRRNKISLKATLDTLDEKDEEDEEDLEDDTNKIFTEKYLRAMLKRSKIAPVNFAFGYGDKPEGDLLTLHPRRAGVALSLLVKRDNGATRLAFGTAIWEGQEVVFTCEKQPIPGLKKRIRRLFREWKLPLKPVIFGPEGRFDEEGDEDDDVEGAATTTEDTRDVRAERLAALAAELKGLLPRFQQLVRANPALTDAMRARYRDCEGALKGGDVIAAADALAQLHQLEGNAGRGEFDNSGAELEAMAAELQSMLPHLKELVHANPALTDWMRTHFHDCETALKGGDAILGRRLLDELKSKDTSAATSEGALIAQLQLALDKRVGEVRSAIGMIADAKARQEKTDFARELYHACQDALKAGNVAIARDVLAQMKILATPPVNASQEIGQFMKSLTLDFRKAQMEWLQARRNTHKAVRMLQNDLQDILRDEPEFNRLEGEIRKLGTIVAELDDKLEAKLVDAIGEADYDRKLKLKGEALIQVRLYREAAMKNPYLSKMDSIPDRPMTVFADLMAHLASLESTLS